MKATDDKANPKNNTNPLPAKLNLHPILAEVVVSLSLVGCFSVVVGCSAVVVGSSAVVVGSS